MNTNSVMVGPDGRQETGVDGQPQIDVAGVNKQVAEVLQIDAVLSRLQPGPNIVAWHDPFMAALNQVQTAADAERVFQTLDRCARTYDATKTGPALWDSAQYLSEAIGAAMPVAPDIAYKHFLKHREALKDAKAAGIGWEQAIMTKAWRTIGRLTNQGKPDQAQALLDTFRAELTAVDASRVKTETIMIEAKRRELARQA